MVKKRYVQWTYRGGDGEMHTERREIRSYTSRSGEERKGVFLGRVGNGNLKMFTKVSNRDDAIKACEKLTPFPTNVEIVELDEGD